jgi:hypothetical protein
MRLLAGGAEGPGRVLALAPEAFASGPVQGRVIAGEDDGRRSLVRALDPVSGCANVLAQVRDAVVRSAVASADGRTLYEHRVDRRTRADLGVWRRELAGWQARGPARRVLDPMPADPRYGPAFTTALAVSATGDVVVASCGEMACRTRVLAADGIVRSIGPTGPALGTAGGTVIARQVCSGLPCPIVAHDPDGSTRMLMPDARLAALGGAAGGTLLAEGADGRLHVVDVGSGTTTALEVGGLLPVGGGSLATSGATSSPGEVVLAPGGRVAGPAGLRRVLPVVGEVAP